MAFATQPAFPATAERGLFARLLGDFLARRATRQRRAYVLNQLGRYSDRELADMGISRGDFPAIASGELASR